MKFHDLKEKQSTVGEAVVKRVSYPSLYLTIKQIPELEDYELGDEVEFMIKAVVYRESKVEGQPKDLGLEMHEAAIVNIKKDREDADEMGMSVSDYKEISSSRKKKNK